MPLHWIPSKQEWINEAWSRSRSGRKFIHNKLDSKPLKSQTKDYPEGNENTRSTERP